MHFLGINWVGVTQQNGQKLLLSISFLFAVFLLRAVLHLIARLVLRGKGGDRRQYAHFWTQQAINLAFAVVITLGLLSIWFENPAQLATALSLVSAGLAFALQRVVTAFAGYLVILRGNNFNIGDRISMGGVRGDVIALGFMQTTILEMGSTPGGDAGRRCG